MSIKINTNASAQLIQMFSAPSLSLAKQTRTSEKNRLLIIGMMITQQVANYVSRQYHLYMYLVGHLFTLFQKGSQMASVICKVSSVGRKFLIDNLCKHWVEI